jgi:hypothetical protein
LKDAPTESENKVELEDNSEEEKLLTEEEIFEETVLEIATEEISLKDEPVRAPLCGCFKRSYSQLGTSNTKKFGILELFKVKKLLEVGILRFYRKKMWWLLLYFMA